MASLYDQCLKIWFFSPKYRILVVVETKSAIDNWLGEKSKKNCRNIDKILVARRLSAKKSRMRQYAHWARVVPKNHQFIGNFLGDFLRLLPCIQWSYLNFWRSNDPNFTRVFVKASNYQICDPIVENQIWLDPTTRKCFQWIYEDLIVEFEPNFDPMTKIKFQRLIWQKKSINTHSPFHFIHKILIIFFYLHQKFLIWGIWWWRVGLTSNEG